MGLLDGDLANTINGALNFLMRNITLIKKDARPYDGGVGSFTGAASETSITCRGFREDFTQAELASGNVVANAVCKVLLLQKSFTGTPQMGDRLVLDGTSYIIVKIGADPANATWELQVG